MAERIPFLASLAVYALDNLSLKDDLTEKDEFILFFKIVLGTIASAARILIHMAPQTAALSFLLYLSFFYELQASVFLIALPISDFYTGYKLKPYVFECLEISTLIQYEGNFLPDLVSRSFKFVFAKSTHPILNTHT